MFAARGGQSQRCRTAKATSLKEIQGFNVYHTLEAAPVFTRTVWWRPFVMTVCRGENGKGNAGPMCFESVAYSTFSLNWLSDAMQNERLRHSDMVVLQY